jgi:hypothetical protein
MNLRKEIETVALTTLYFAVWLGFRGMSLALLGALVIAKVVLILEHVPLGQWVRRHAALVDVALRTLMYTLGVVVVLLLEKAFESRHENGGFGAALAKVFQHRDIPHVWANTICVGSALLVFNALAVLRHHLGMGRLIPLFLKPLKGAR